MLPKKRCSVCRKMFRPDPRVGDRQRACSAEPCQLRRRAETQASWRSRNPSYPTGYRLEKRAAEAAAASSGERAREGPSEPPPPLRLPKALASFPWDLAQSELGFVGADLLAILALWMVRQVHLVKDPKRGEKPVFMQDCAPTGRDP